MLVDKPSTDFETWQNRSDRCIAQGCLTNSKHPDRFPSVFPSHVTRGDGAYVWDTDGSRYIDFICGLGTNLLGFSNHHITNLIKAELDKGVCLSLSTDIEVKAAERLREVFPWADRWKFLKTGSEACSAAVRIARAHTGRDHLSSTGYHGWHDEFTSLTKPASGVPPMTFIKGSEWDRVDDAAVIIEPVQTKLEGAREHLVQLRERTRHTGTVLIFDEVITGFRTPGLSMSSYLNVEPDLIVLGKAMAGGFPLAAVGGKQDIMDGDYFVSSTYAGDRLSLLALLKTIDLLTISNEYSLAYLWEKGQQFLDRFNALFPDEISIEGYPTRGVFKGKPETIAKFQQEMAKAGVLFGPSWFFSFPHVEHMEVVLNLCQDVLTRVRFRQVKLEGDMPTSPFSKKVRES